MDPINTSDIAAAIKAGQDQYQPIPDAPGYARSVIVPKTAEVRTLAREKVVAPRFLTAAPTFNDANAFIDYVNAFKKPETRIFRDQVGEFVAVFDYHRPRVPNTDGTGDTGLAAQHGDHIATLKLIRSPEWQTWDAKSEEAMSQQEFAEFIEDNVGDIIEPDGKEMLAVATGLHATIGATFRQAINQANGTVNLQWDEQVDGTVRGTGKSIPSEFKVGLRPFMGTSRYPIDCRFRYRVNGGRLALHYKTLHMDPVTEAALEAVVLGISDQTGITPALGAHNAAAFKLGI